MYPAAPKARHARFRTKTTRPQSWNLERACLHPDTHCEVCFLPTAAQLAAQLAAQIARALARQVAEQRTARMAVQLVVQLAVKLAAQASTLRTASATLRREETRISNQISTNSRPARPLKKPCQTNTITHPTRKPYASAVSVVSAASAAAAGAS